MTFLFCLTGTFTAVLQALFGNNQFRYMNKHLSYKIFLCKYLISHPGYWWLIVWCDLYVTKYIFLLNFSECGLYLGALYSPENMVSQTIEDLHLYWEKLATIMTDGAPSMVGASQGLIGRMNQEMEERGLTAPLQVHCLIHQQALCCKVLKWDSVLKVVVSCINFIRATGLKHRHSCLNWSLCTEMCCTTQRSHV